MSQIPPELGDEALKQWRDTWPRGQSPGYVHAWIECRERAMKMIAEAIRVNDNFCREIADAEIKLKERDQMIRRLLDELVIPEYGDGDYVQLPLIKEARAMVEGK